MDPRMLGWRMKKNDGIGSSYWEKVVYYLDLSCENIFKVVNHPSRGDNECWDI